MSITTVPTKIYLGKRKYNNDKSYHQDYPLAFLTWYEKEDAAFKTRKKSMDSWCHSNDPDELKKNYSDRKGPESGVFTLMDNTPASGFFIKDYVSRWSTSNKYFNVSDPRGFTLQVTAECLTDIIEACTIEKGLIKEECVWGRKGGQNVLLPVDSEPYRNSVKNSDSVPKVSDLKFGDRVIVFTEPHRYLGKKFITKLRCTITSELIDKSDYYNKKFKITFNQWEVASLAGSFYVFTQEKYNNKYIRVVSKAKLKSFIESDPTYSYDHNGSMFHSSDVCNSKGFTKKGGYGELGHTEVKIVESFFMFDDYADASAFTLDDVREYYNFPQDGQIIDNSYNYIKDLNEYFKDNKK